MNTCHGIPFLPSYDRKVVFKMNESILALKYKKQFIREEIIMNPETQKAEGMGLKKKTFPKMSKRVLLEKVGADPRLLQAQKWSAP